MTTLDQVVIYVLMLVWLERLARRVGDYRTAAMCRIELMWLADTFYVQAIEATNQRGK